MVLNKGWLSLAEVIHDRTWIWGKSRFFSKGENRFQGGRTIHKELEACFWNIPPVCCFSVGHVLSSIDCKCSWHPLLCPAPSSPALQSQHTYKGSLILSALYSKACTWPCTQSRTWLFKEMTLVPCLPLCSSVPHPTLLFWGSLCPTSFKRINCHPLMRVSFFQGISCKKGSGWSALISQSFPEG